MAADADLAGLRTDVSGLRVDVQALVQGLTLMLESQQTIGEMMEQLLQAVTKEVPTESPLETALKAMTEAIADQSEVMDRVGTSMNDLKTTIAGAIIRGAGQPALAVTG